MSESRAEQLLRDLAPQVLGALVRRYRDFAASEDAVQEALIAAAEHWPREGIPDNPRGWLLQTASRRMTDHFRREKSRQAREAVVAEEAADVTELSFELDDAIDPNDTLVLLFMCCHPSLSNASAIALTLRAVGGLTTTEIAKAFLVPSATMGQRISRAKKTIKESGVSFSTPHGKERDSRVESVLHVLYLMFNEGYTASEGAELVRVDLCREAIRLTRSVRTLLPERGDVAGLLALMLLTDARRAARTGPNGELIPLDQQDRSLWDPRAIAEGIALATEALNRGSLGEYQLLAAIAAVHDEAPSAKETDWPEILALYAMLMRTTSSPVVAINHAVATAMVHGPRVGLELLAGLESDLRVAAGHRLDAVRAHLLERAGDPTGAIVLYRSAAEKAASLPERDYLLMRAAKLADAINRDTPR